MKRYRALDKIKKQIDWKVHNPVFEINTPDFDKAFSSKHGIKHEYYLERDQKNGKTFEDRMCETIFSSHAHPDNKLVILRGNVGTGKTSFSIFMGKKKLPSLYHSFFVYVNCYNRLIDNDSTYNDFEELFRNAFIENLLASDMYHNEVEIAVALAKFRGISKPDQHTSLEHLDLSTPSQLMPFLLKDHEYQRILIVIDNMDDCSSHVRELAFTFSQRLSDLAQENNDSNHVSILLPIRKYTNVTTDTENYHSIDIPTISVSEIMKTKIKHVYDMVSDKNISINEYIPHEEYRKRTIQTRDGEKIIFERLVHGKYIQLSNITTLIAKILNKTEVSMKGGLLDFISNISSGNMKLVTRNTYNIFHSCKLDYTNVVKFAYTPEDSLNYKSILKKIESGSFGPPIIYDLTMAIHYPFYDTRSSNIINLFNLDNSTVPNDYKNTFAILRLLIYVYNVSVSTKKTLYNSLISVGYDKFMINKALQKCLNYSIVETEYGTKIDHLSDNTIIQLSSAGTFMLENSLADPRYLSYALEDTPMEEQYIIPLADKCSKGNINRNITLTKLSINEFLSFLAKEESLEIDYVTNELGWDKEKFLSIFSLQYNYQYQTISKVINSKIGEYTAEDKVTA